MPSPSSCICRLYAASICNPHSATLAVPSPSKYRLERYVIYQITTCIQESWSSQNPWLHIRPEYNGHRGELEYDSDSPNISYFHVCQAGVNQYQSEEDLGAEGIFARWRFCFFLCTIWLGSLTDNPKIQLPLSAGMWITWSNVCDKHWGYVEAVVLPEPDVTPPTYCINEWLLDLDYPRTSASHLLISISWPWETPLDD